MRIYRLFFTGSIIPIYYFLHLFYLICNFNTIDFKQYIIYTPIELLGLQSIFSNVMEIFHNGGTWFISCLIICYLVYPLLHNLIINIRSINKAIALLVIFVFLLVYLPIYNTFSESLSLYTNPFYRLLEFATGVVIARIVFDENIINVINSNKKTYNILSTSILFAIVCVYLINILNGNMFIKNYYIFLLLQLFPCQQ